MTTSTVYQVEYGVEYDGEPEAGGQMGRREEDARKHGQWGDHQARQGGDVLHPLGQDAGERRSRIAR